MNRKAVAVVTILLLTATAPAAMGTHEGWSNRDRCENRTFAANPGIALSGERCLRSPIGFWSGEHVRVDLLPFDGYDKRNTTLAAYPYEAGHERGWNASATPVWQCLEGWNGQVYVDECSSQYPYLTTTDLPYGTYVFVQTLNLNLTEIAPTVFGITIPTGLAVSGGWYGFELTYNRNCHTNPDGPDC